MPGVTVTFATLAGAAPELAVQTKGPAPLADKAWLCPAQIVDKEGVMAIVGVAEIETVADVNKITKIVRVVGYVNGVPGYINAPVVVNGASELFLAIWGDGAKHARSAVGIAELPLNSPVEIELTVEITD